MSMEQFFIRKRASEGKKFPLRNPDGTPTDYFIVIRSRWSDEFRKAREESMRAAALKVAAEGKNIDAEKAATEAALSQIAALVVSWNLPEEFTPENVMTLLREAPQIADAIDRAAGNDRDFFKAGSIS